jgi:hypothetical protein
MESMRMKMQSEFLKVVRLVTHPRLQAFSWKNTEVAQHFQPFELLHSPLLDFGSIFVVLLRGLRCARCCRLLFLSALMRNQAHHACHIAAHTVQRRSSTTHDGSHHGNEGVKNDFQRVGPGP